MRNTIIISLLLVLLVPLGVTSAQEDPVCESVLLLDMRARPAVGPTSAAYGMVVNLTDEEVILSGGETDIAEAVEIHTMSVDEDDVMSMMPLSDGLSIPPGTAAEFAPGGLHVMLIGLADILEADSEVALTLNFDDAGEVELAVPVLDIDADMDMSETSDEEMDMDDDMSHQVSFDVLVDCDGLESVWVGAMNMGDMPDEEMDMDESHELSLRLVFEDMSEVTHTLPIITAASMMDMDMEDMEMDG